MKRASAASTGSASGKKKGPNDSQSAAAVAAFEAAVTSRATAGGKTFVPIPIGKRLLPVSAHTHVHQGAYTSGSSVASDSSYWRERRGGGQRRSIGGWRSDGESTLGAETSDDEGPAMTKVKGKAPQRYNKYNKQGKIKGSVPVVVFFQKRPFVTREYHTMSDAKNALGANGRTIRDSKWPQLFGLIISPFLYRLTLMPHHTLREIIQPRAQQTSEDSRGKVSAL
ncbi:MAG: hypothetical protein GWQ05_03255 [Verrucomicrobiaceae bacterium]|nr:hypothetical protein [Verrucomicrobiaceae bacterium]